MGYSCCLHVENEPAGNATSIGIKGRKVACTNQRLYKQQTKNSSNGIGFRSKYVSGTISGDTDSWRGQPKTKSHHPDHSNTSYLQYNH
jgi:hypothetical protein